MAEVNEQHFSIYRDFENPEYIGEIEVAWFGDNAPTKKAWAQIMAAETEALMKEHDART